MSSSAASNADDEPPRKINKPMSPPLFSSLPIEIVWSILARVPKRSYPILSCVSKNFRNLVRSPEIHKTRSFLGKDSLFICFIDNTNPVQTRNWFTLRRTENNPIENQFVSIALMYPFYSKPDPFIIAIGPEIFIISKRISPSPSLWIFDSRSEKIRQGPNKKLCQSCKCVGFVGNKIYVIGGCKDDKIQAESFDIKMQTWEPAPIPEGQCLYMWGSAPTASLNKKVYALRHRTAAAFCYDTRDGSCEILRLPRDCSWETGLCVIDNVLYTYYARSGLIWYDFKLTRWRVVNGLNHLNKVQFAGMAEYYGKLAVLWEESSEVCGETKEIWCRMIALCRSEVGIQGAAEPAQLLGSVPRGYRLHHCLSVSD